MNNKGFILIEMVVVALIFAIVMGAAIGVFATAFKLQRYNLAYQQLLNQVSYAMEYMERSIRMAMENNGTCSFSSPNCAGKNNYCNISGSNSIRFVDYKNRCQTFTLSNQQIRSNNSGIFSGAGFYLTSDDFRVTMLRFNISGDAAGSQPRVTIVMQIESKAATILSKPKIKIQTTVSQRNLNI